VTGLLAVVITVSDRSAAGSRPDESGPIAVAALREAGWNATGVVVQDGAGPVGAALEAALSMGARLVVTSGGTGVSPRDETPEATARILAKELPGVSEELRRIGSARLLSAVLSRGVAGVAVGAAGGAFVVNLPGSPNGVAEGMPLVLALAEHVIGQLDGEDH
jgi:molybdenum cofactor synthesis domain-containing protein